MTAHLPIAEKFTALGPILTEQGRRLWAATEAMVLGPGGVRLGAQATGLSRPTLDAGIRELRGEPAAVPSRGQGRSRRAGGGRKRRVEPDPTLRADLEALVEPTTRGDPPSPRRWTCTRVRRLAEALRAQGPQVSPPVVGPRLHEADDSWPGTRKTRAGGTHPDRHAPFEPIAARGRDCQTRHPPGSSVEAQQKALGGDFKHAGRAWHPKGQPPPGRVDACSDPTRGQARPAGVYDVRAHLGWVSVGVDPDTPACAVATLRAWWRQLGSPMSPTAQELLITADRGGRHRPRARLWTLERPRFSDASGLRVGVSPLPPGTRTWHTSEPRMCCHLTATWRGKPLESLEGVVRRSGDPNTAAGVRIQAALDAGQSPKGIKVSDAAMKTLPSDRAQFHGAWNAMILPHRDSKSHTTIPRKS